MKLHIYQIAIIVISGLMIHQGITNYVKGKNGQTIYKLFIRIIIWGSMAIVGIFPDIISVLAKMLGIIDNMNAVILTGFLFIFLMIFKLLSAIERLEQQLSEVIRKDSLKEIEK